MRRIIFKGLLALTICLIACTNKKDENIAQRTDFISENIEFARAQIGNHIKIIEDSGKFLNPVTVRPDGSVYYCNFRDWRSGFFPGSVWYLYELSGDTVLQQKAIAYTEAIEEAKYLTSHHDIGFIIGSSFGNALRLTKNDRYKGVIVEAAKSLITRYREKPGVIQSWNLAGWQGERGWECPVIIDNMMNLELLFDATEYSGDSIFHKIAVSHADRTLKEHFRPDASTYHVIDYSITDGSVRSRQTAQGYSDESIWSRGQAWAIYGYTMCYRETGDQKYMNQAIKTFELMKNHPKMPEDLIPYWDMDAPNIPNEPRDVSSASIIASALYEMSTYQLENSDAYKQYADSIMQSLSSTNYRAEVGSNGNFLLMHSVGSIPHNNEIDAPLNYADYYFLEAIQRKMNIEKE